MNHKKLVEAYNLLTQLDSLSLKQVAEIYEDRTGVKIPLSIIRKFSWTGLNNQIFLFSGFLVNNSLPDFELSEKELSKKEFQDALFEMGWRVFGFKDDPYFKIYFKDGKSLSGNFDESDNFEIFGIKNKYNSPEIIKEYFSIVGFEVNWNTMNRCGEKNYI